MFITIFIDIAILTTMGIILYRFYKNFDSFASSYGAEILTTLGIFGCFLGTLISLFSLDPNDVTGTMPSFLSSIKTAFICSAFGVLGALLIRARHKFKEPKGETVLSTIKSMHKDQNRNFRIALRFARKGSNKLVEMNQQALIIALNNIVSDFNNHFTTQFGENFKHLNSAVEKLVVWQTEYKNDLDKIIVHQKNLNHSLDIIKDTSPIFDKKIIEVLEAMKYVHDSFLKDVEKYQHDINSQITTNVTNINASLKTVEKSLEYSLISLDDNLSALGNKFLEDYTPLTEALQKVVNIAKDIKLPEEA